ncbi:single-stranded DNA-binding protein [Adhaeribacter arboris]|nr:single-stranded DNA-binding protein [Adhaeribacter arboris]
MRGLNKVSLIGSLGKDPDFQYLEENVAVAKISVATTPKFLKTKMAGH